MFLGRSRRWPGAPHPSDTTQTFISGRTSEWRWIATVYAPSCFNGSSSRIACRSTAMPSSASFSAMSELVTEPNSRPPSPDFTAKVTERPASCSASLSAVGGHVRDALRNEVVAGESRLHIDYFADLAEILHILTKNHFHHFRSPA
jgi:hypothetical protein